jgi:hypothetical protein
METFLEIIREIAKAVVRECAAYIFRRSVIDQKKTTPRRRKQKGGSPRQRLNLFDNHHPDGRGCGREVHQHFSLFLLYVNYT